MDYVFTEQFLISHDNCCKTHQKPRINEIESSIKTNTKNLHYITDMTCNWYHVNVLRRKTKQYERDPPVLQQINVKSLEIVFKFQTLVEKLGIAFF